MEILGKDRLVKLKRKNIGNSKLIFAIDKLISDLEKAEWAKKTDIKLTRSDADCVHADGFYFFDINIHRTMVLIIFEKDVAIIVWTGSHDEYNTIFKGNKKTIENWLRNQQLI
ncbi:MAG: type II toxin-antitoxin system HigB family toxin [Bacteroidota bacterium]|nr:type II toxin-antitoxin system HigB family toxin [Bacteroidota bacterium]